MTRHGGTERKSGPYRARDGMIFGVCKGLADHLDVSVFWLRVVTVVLCFFTVFWVLIFYLVAALVMKPEPVVPFETEAEEEFYTSFTSSRSMALHRLKRTFDRLDRRIRRMEGIVTDKEYDWDRRFNQ